jgi:aspartyl-tRNA(Asn)/glutamyl-tRNA(Gln) amidotransferase subunit A
MEINKLSIKKIHDALKKGEFSSVDLTKNILNKIEKENEKFGAFLNISSETALFSAKKIDEKISRGEDIGLISGIPVAIKDNILVEGEKCTAGSKILKDYIAPYDAFVVKKLKEAGAIIVGKTNMDEFAMGSSGENSAFFPARNPNDLERVPGGSSSGSAVAVSANLSFYALGSDTGGSIRQPASFCGIVGLKPTYGAVSRYGVMAMASSLDQIGPLTKTVEDSKIVFNTIKGRDIMDSTSMDFKATDFKAKKEKIKIGIPKECFVEGIDSGVENMLKKVIEKVKNIGADIEEISLPNMKYAMPCYYIIMPSEVSANLSRFDGIKYGHSEVRKSGADIKNLLDVYLKSRQGGFGDEVKRRIMIGVYALSSGYYDAYYLRAQKARRLVREDFEKAFKKVDLIFTPTSPTTAFKIGEKTQDPLSMYLADIFTVSINLAGVPALSMPCGKIDGLPVGLQVIGPWFGEEKIFDFSEKLEKEIQYK